MTKEEMKNTTRITEENIVLSFLSVLASANEFYKKAQKVPTELIKEALKDSLPLSDLDREPLKNRKDTKVDQVIRNLVSHNTLVKKGYATKDEDGWQISEKGKDVLLDVLISEIGFSPDFDEVEKNIDDVSLNIVSSEDPNAPEARLSEMDILDDFVFVLIRAEHFYKAKGKENKSVSTAIVKNILKQRLPITEEDAKPLKGRKDTKIDQIIRNLVSHNTLVKNGYASKDKEGWQVSEKGKDFVLSIFLKKFGIHYDFEKIVDNLQNKKEANYKANLKQYQPKEENKAKKKP